jgi:hypothetical protein
MAAGKQLAKTWQAKTTAEHRDLLSKVVARIVVHDDRLELVIIQFRLRDTLLGVQQNDLNEHERRAEFLKKDILNLLIDMRVKRCGREVRLIVPVDSELGMPVKTVPALIKVITRVHQWPTKIVNGEFKGRHSIAQQTGIEERYAGRILNCAFLAPDIIEAILEGRQPADLTVQKLLRALPVEWAGQRKRLGFAE